MQTFIADGRVSDIPQDAVGKTSNGNVSRRLASSTFKCTGNKQK